MHKINPLSTITEAAPTPDGQWVNLTCSLGHKTGMAADEYGRRTSQVTWTPWSSQEVCPTCRCLEAMLPPAPVAFSGTLPKDFFPGVAGSGTIPFGKP
jgi:hypothetical protein